MYYSYYSPRGGKASAIQKRVEQTPGLSYHNSFRNDHAISLYDCACRRFTSKEFKALTVSEVDKIIDEMRAQFPRKALAVLDRLIPQLVKVMRPSINIKSFRYYPEFRMLTYMGDGFPTARFVFSQDFKKVFFAFVAPYKDNEKLSHAANPECIPHIFPIADFPKHFGKIQG